MRRLIVGILVVALIWMGWWAFGASALDKSLTAWVDARRAEGWAADVADIEVNGFPNRFDTTITDVRLADPETGVAWSAPFLQILALAYKPHQVIAVLPSEHSLATPLQTITFAHDQARGSVFLEASTALALERSTIVIDALDIGSDLGWNVGLEQGRFATEQVPAKQFSHRIGAELVNLTPSSGARRMLDPTRILPAEIETIRLDATVAFTAPWDRFAVEDARPQITEIALEEFAARWGEVTFRAVGQLSVDTRGRPEGEITVKAVEWRKLLEMAVSSGMVAEAIAPSVERGLEFLAALKGARDTIDADLTFANGLISIGPVPIGPAPNLTIR